METESPPGTSAIRWPRRAVDALHQRLAQRDKGRELPTGHVGLQRPSREVSGRGRGVKLHFAPTHAPSSRSDLPGAAWLLTFVGGGAPYPWHRVPVTPDTAMQFPATPPAPAPGRAGGSPGHGAAQHLRRLREALDAAGDAGPEGGRLLLKRRLESLLLAAGGRGRWAWLGPLPGWGQSLSIAGTSNRAFFGIPLFGAERYRDSK